MWGRTSRERAGSSRRDGSDRHHREWLSILPCDDHDSAARPTRCRIDPASLDACARTSDNSRSARRGSRQRGRSRASAASRRCSVSCARERGRGSLGDQADQPRRLPLPLELVPGKLECHLPSCKNWTTARYVGGRRWSFTWGPPASRKRLGAGVSHNRKPDAWSKRVTRTQTKLTPVAGRAAAGATRASASPRRDFLAFAGVDPGRVGA